MIEVPNAHQVYRLQTVQNDTTPSALCSREWLPPGWIWFIQAAGAFMNIVGLLKTFDYRAKTLSSNELTQIVPRNLVWFKTEARCSKMSQSSLNLNSDAHAVSPR
jgi:hypothetical protein